MTERSLDSSGRTTSTTSTTTSDLLDKDRTSAGSNDYESITCEICFEPFHPSKRPPKLLPCGHNFCEQCTFSLCCHQQYYLLDSINCPTCRTEFNTSTAFAAPINYDLCRVLEAVKQHRGNNTDGNITVIHVPDSTDTRTTIGQNRRCSWRRSPGRRSSSEKRRSMRCADCFRKLSEKMRRKEARFCGRCFGSKKDTDDGLRVACLECCVNRHNGHQLITLNELEYEHHKLISDLRTLQHSIQETSKQIEARLKALGEDSTMPSSDCDALRKAKQSLRTECEADLKFALSVLENGDTTPLPPAVLQRMRQHQYHNSARKCSESINKRYNRNIKLKSSILYSPLFASSTASVHQTRGSLHNSTSDDRSTTDAIVAALAVACDIESCSRNGTKLVEEALKVLRKKNSTKAQRRVAMFCCAKQLRTFIDEKTSKQSLLLYIDAYLHIFCRLNHLVTRFPSEEEDRATAVTVTRWDVWKLVQVVYTDLMRCATRHWHSEEGERIDLVDDLASLCSLYSDVSDEATITICMIEAARARAAAAATATAAGTVMVTSALQKMDDSEDNERRTMNIRLNLIDEHLLECRRVQKLQQLRVATTSRPRRRTCHRWQFVKRMWKLFSACFSKSAQQEQ